MPIGPELSHMASVQCGKEGQELEVLNLWQVPNYEEER